MKRSALIATVALVAIVALSLDQAGGNEPAITQTASPAVLDASVALPALGPIELGTSNYTTTAVVTEHTGSGSYNCKVVLGIGKQILYGFGTVDLSLGPGVQFTSAVFNGVGGWASTSIEILPDFTTIEGEIRKSAAGNCPVVGTEVGTVSGGLSNGDIYAFTIFGR